MDQKTREHYEELTVRNRKDWVDKFSKLFGCQRRPHEWNEGCWCQICVDTGQAWEEAIQLILEIVNQQRHPAILQQEKKPQ